MKKNFTISLILFGCFSLVHEANAQKIGVGIAYGSEIDAAGVGVNALFPTENDKLIISPNFFFYFPDDPFNFWEANADVNYVFSKSSATVYGIIGLNVARFGRDQVEFSSLTIEESASTEVGLNLGLGADLNLEGSFIPFVQAKYVFSDFDQLVLSAGVRVPF